MMSTYDVKFGLQCPGRYKSFGVDYVLVEQLLLIFINLFSIMCTRIVTLSENTCGMAPGLLAEHGLSVYIEFGKTRLLFDTGQSISAAHNAVVLGIDLTDVPIALSHGHYDHSGGLEHVLRLTGPTEVFCHPDTFAPKYAERQGIQRYIGMRKGQEEYEQMGARFQISGEPRELADGVWLTGEILRITDFEKHEEDLIVLDPEKMADPLQDDQALVLKTAEGLLIVLGCAHSGMINTIEHAKKITGESRVLGVVGGTHLGFGSVRRERLARTIDALKGYDIKLLAVSHCTGLPAACKLAGEFKDRFISNNAGTIIEL
jgi:7,8-dihydropterin-6-yl-methyl-4-(beta-D-ribofuranosyl)aminobenzene 5'-phosphate synthase